MQWLKKILPRLIFDVIRYMPIHMCGRGPFKRGFVPSLAKERVQKYCVDKKVQIEDL